MKGPQPSPAACRPSPAPAARGIASGWDELSATWKRERDIPWDEEARVNDVIDPA